MKTEKSDVKNMLCKRVWIGNIIDMPGLYATAIKIFGDSLELTFRKYGRCTLVMPDKKINARWRLKDDELDIKGKGIDTKGNIRHDNGVPYSVTLYEVGGYMVSFDPKDKEL